MAFQAHSSAQNCKFKNLAAQKILLLEGLVSTPAALNHPTTLNQQKTLKSLQEILLSTKRVIGMISLGWVQFYRLFTMNRQMFDKLLIKSTQKPHFEIYIKKIKFSYLSYLYLSFLLAHDMEFSEVSLLNQIISPSISSSAIQPIILLAGRLRG